MGGKFGASHVKGVLCPQSITSSVLLHYVASENEVKLAQKALKSQKDVDDRAVKVAGKMQKEVTEKRSQIDSLNSKMSWLQESLDSAVKVSLTNQVNWRDLWELNFGITQAVTGFRAGRWQWRMLRH